MYLSRASPCYRIQVYLTYRHPNATQYKCICTRHHNITQYKLALKCMRVCFTEHGSVAFPRPCAEPAGPGSSACAELCWGLVERCLSVEEQETVTLLIAPSSESTSAYSSCIDCIDLNKTAFCLCVCLRVAVS